MKEKNKFKQILHLMNPEFSKYFLGILYTLIATIATVGSSITLKYLVDDILLANKPQYLWTIQIVFIILVLIQTIFSIMRRVVYEKASLNILSRLKRDLSSKLVKSKYAEFELKNHGDIISTINYDVNGIGEYLVNGLANLISSIMSIIITLGFMLTLDVKLTLITLPIFPLIIIIFTFLQKKVKEHSVELQNSRKKNTNIINTILKELLFIKSLSIENKFIDKYTESSIEMQNNSVKLNILYTVMSFAGWSMIMVPYQAIMYGVAGTWYFETGVPSIGLMLAFANYANSLISPVLNIQDYQKNWTYTKVCLDNINELDNLPQENIDVNNDFNARLEKYDYSFSNVDFAYKKNHTVINDLSLSIPENSISVLYGESGSGKSTILKLIFRLYDIDSGKITLDGIDIKELNLKQYRQNIVYLPQDIRLFNGTIYDNFKLINPNITDDEVKEILELTSLTETIKKLPNGLNTNVGEDGNIISGGQKQRIAIAQALLKHSKVILLDEPTSALDVYNKELLLKTLETIKYNHTIILTSHDNDIKRYADLIINL